MGNLPLLLLTSLSLVIAGAAAAQETLHGAGRDAVTLRWEPASGPVAYYAVTCTVDGEADVLVGTTVEPALVVADGVSTHARYSRCRVRAYDAEGDPGPASKRSAAGFEFLPNADLDGDLRVGLRDLLALRRRGAFSAALWVTLNRLYGCDVDPEQRIYVCADGAR